MNITEIPTPRTDAEESAQTQRFGGYMVKADFARQLERENAAMREAIKEARALFDDFSKARHYDDSTASTIQLGWIVSKSEETAAKLKPYLP